MPLISLDDEDQRWVPTHVNVTVIRARALRTKGKQGSRYVYTVMQLGKLKYTTGLAEKSTEPEWNEECSLELQPGLLEYAGAHPHGSGDLILTVMLRVLIGLDVFLGEAVVPLDKLFQSGTCPRNEWLKLHSKSGRKEKERGELQLTIQFTRNNMTASMYDLTVQDKPRSAFGKLKDRVTGKKKGDVESSSAILPGRYAALSSSTSQAFQEDGGAGNPVQDECTDEGKSKVKGFFLKGKLRKNSDTRSCSSLASESSMASSAGDPFVPIELCSTPVYSSRVVEPFRTDPDGGVKVFTAPKVMTHKRAHSDEASKITVAARQNMAVESVKGQNTLLSKSTLCINGSHVYSEPIYSKGPGSLPIKRTLLEKCSPLSRSLQNLTRRNEDTQRRSSIDKSKKDLEGDVEGSSALAMGVPNSDGKLVHATAPLVMASSTSDVADKGKKLRKTLFSSGRSDSLPAKPEQGQEGRLRGWFGSADTQNKPRLGVPPKVESSPETSASLSPCHSTQSPRSLPLVSATSNMSSFPVGSESNPFSHPSPPPASISPTNPFLTRLQRNPFFEELIAEEALKSPPAISDCRNSPFNHYPAFPGRTGLPSTVRDITPNKMFSIKRERPRSVAKQRSLPALTPETTTVNSNNAMQASRPLSESMGEWDEFEALATSRLKSPVGTPTRPLSATISSSPSNTYPVEYCSTEPKMQNIVDERTSKDYNLPVLASRRPMRTPVPFQERCSDSWLDRAQELAVQKEACVLFQTDLASIRHRERHRDANNKVSHLGKDLHCATLEQNLNIYPTSHTVQMTRDENLNTLENEQEKFLTERGLKYSQFGYEHTQQNSQNSASDHTVPSTPFCLSDCDTTVSESMCSDFQVQINPESSSAPKPITDEQMKSIITTEDITNQDSNNNNTNDTSQFAFIDCDSSHSDLNQTTFGMINKGRNKASPQCAVAADFDPSAILSVCGFSSVPPQDLLNRMAELEHFSPKDTPDTVVVASGLSDNNHYEKPCDNLEQHSIQPHSNITVRFESEDSNYKDSSVSPQTIPQRDRNDGNMTALFKPEATEDNAGFSTPHEVGCCLIYDKIKTKKDEVMPEANSLNVTVSESHKISESPLTLTDAISFEDLHARVAPRGSQSPSKTEVRSARIRTHSTTSFPKSDPNANLPTASSNISLTKPSLSVPKSPSPSFFHPNVTSDPSLSSLMHYSTTKPGLGSTLTEASNTTSTPQLQATAKHTLTPEEAEPASSRPPAEESSPHPVKPLTSTAVPGEKKSVLEKLRSSIHPGRSTQQNMAEPEKPPVWMSEAHTHYQTLSNMELIALLLQQEMDAERQRAESELQATLLEKREAEVKKLKVQVRDLEDYIDKLLVQIMEQTPTLLQVRARPK